MFNNIRIAAREAALVHQEEFPGEPISGDWDVESWVEYGHRVEMSDSDREEYWPLYHDVLHATVLSLVRIVNSNPSYGDAVEFVGFTIEDAVRRMQAHVRACGEDFANVVVTENDYDVR